MDKVICLSRVSTLSQELESQKNKVYEVIRNDGFNDSQIIDISNKESGVILSEYEMLGLDTLKEEILKGGVVAVYVYELSRIARQAKILYSIRDFLIEHKVQLVCVNPSFRMFRQDGSFDDSSNVIFALYCSLAENEGFIRKARFKRGKERKKLEGRFVGGRVLYGYRLDEGNRYMQDPETSLMVKRIFDMYVSGEYSARQIASILYKEGILNQASPYSREGFIIKLLKNKSYCGVFPYLRIIDDDTFNKVQDIIKGYQIKPRRVYEDNVYYGHKLLLESGDRCLLVRKGDNAYIGKFDNICININMVDSLLVDRVDFAIKYCKEYDIKDKVKDIEKKIKEVRKRLVNYDVLVKRIQDKIDMLETRLINGRISVDKVDMLEKSLLKEKLDLEQSKNSDISDYNNLIKEVEVLRSGKVEDVDVYGLSDKEVYDLVHKFIKCVHVSKVDDEKCYECRVVYNSPFIDDEVYRIYGKKHIIKYKVDDDWFDLYFTLLKRFKRFHE